jgi:glycerol-3-phosphate dehydrogenase
MDLEGLKQDDLQAVFRYHEAQTDDAALTRAVLQSAMQLGAECEIPAQFVGAKRNPKSCSVDYVTPSGSKNVSCRVLVNCAGPWVNEVLGHIQPALPTPAIELVQGSHLLLPPLLKQYFYLEAPEDKRAVFVLPWQGKLLVGTTEKIHTEAPEQAHCTLVERDYLLATLRHYFPHLAIAENTIESFAGLRVLPRSEKNAFARTREVLFAVDDEVNPRVLSLMGGKLTTYRATAQMALERLKHSLPVQEMKADTRQLHLTPVN